MGWQWETTNTLEYLTIPEWSHFGVKVAFSTRNHGVSTAPYDTLNLAFHVHDQADKVIENRNRFLRRLNSGLEHCTAAEQIHGMKIVTVTENHKGMGMYTQATAIPECDGMVTQENVDLMCLYADCVPLYFFSPSIGMIGIAHAGWKGTVNGIAKEVLKKFRLAGGTAQDCYAAIGPCIGACCYEVGKDVARIVNENFNDQNILVPTAPGKYHLDLVKANLQILINEGVAQDKISIADLCTSCHSELFYSYRREGITGRMAAYISKEKGVC